MDEELGLPPGYYLNAVTDPDVTILRGPDGSVVAIFGVEADPREIERVAWEDHEQR